MLGRRSKARAFPTLVQGMRTQELVAGHNVMGRFGDGWDGRGVEVGQTARFEKAREESEARVKGARDY